jgi:membrane protein YqaA with SNARE-associated domain
VLGAVAGYWIGYHLWDSIGVKIVGPIPEKTREMLLNDAFTWTLVYSFVPLPFKLITLGSGFMHLNLATLLVASTIGRSGRFFLLAAICYAYGPRARGFIEKHFNKVCLGIGVFVAVAVVVLKVILKR